MTVHAPNITYHNPPSPTHHTNSKSVINNGITDQMYTNVVKLQGQGPRLGADFTFASNKNKKKKPHLIFKECRVIQV